MKIARFILLSVLSIIALSSCNLMTSPIMANKRDKMYLQNIGQHKLYYLPVFETLDTHEKIANYISIHVDYRRDPKNTDSGASPIEVLYRGFGDCEDLSILYANIAYYGMGIRMSFTLEDTKLSPVNRAVVNNEVIPNHVAPCYGGQIYNVFSGGHITYEHYFVGHEYAFGEVLL